MTAHNGTHRRGLGRWLMLALLVVPVVEVLIILQVGHAIGGWPTFGLLVLWSALGAWIVKREFGRAFAALRQAFGTGRMPTRELSDAALVLVGGTLLLAPGFLTDAIGLFVLLPFTRPLTRRILERAVAAKLFGTVRRATFATAPGFETASYQVWGSSSTTGSPRGGRRRHRGEEEIIEGEIID